MIYKNVNPGKLIAITLFVAIVYAIADEFGGWSIVIIAIIMMLGYVFIIPTYEWWRDKRRRR